MSGPWPTPWADGMEVMAAGRLSVYAQRGVYQLVAELVQEVGGRQALAGVRGSQKGSGGQGLFRSGPQKAVAAASDPGGGGDGRRPARPYGISSASAGSGAMGPRSGSIRPWSRATRRPVGIVRAMLRAVADDWAEVLVLIRGGGSLEDLWAFNSTEVAGARLRLAAAGRDRRRSRGGRDHCRHGGRRALRDAQPCGPAVVARAGPAGAAPGRSGHDPAAAGYGAADVPGTGAGGLGPGPGLAVAGPAAHPPGGGLCRAGARLDRGGCRLAGLGVSRRLDGAGERLARRFGPGKPGCQAGGVGAVRRAVADGFQVFRYRAGAVWWNWPKRGWPAWTPWDRGWPGATA